MTSDALPALPLRDGGAMPILGFGTWQITGRKAYEAVTDALDVGYRHLDTATVYDNEKEVGRALHDSGVNRDDVFLTTKVPPDRAGRERATIETSLRDLGTDHVDLWLIHWPPDKQWCRDRDLAANDPDLRRRGSLARSA